MLHYLPERLESETAEDVDGSPAEATRALDPLPPTPAPPKSRRGLVAFLGVCVLLSAFIIGLGLITGSNELLGALFFVAIAAVIGVAIAGERSAPRRPSERQRACARAVASTFGRAPEAHVELRYETDEYLDFFPASGGKRERYSIAAVSHFGERGKLSVGVLATDDVYDIERVGRQRTVVGASQRLVERLKFAVTPPAGHPHSPVVERVRQACTQQGWAVENCALTDDGTLRGHLSGDAIVRRMVDRRWGEWPVGLLTPVKLSHTLAVVSDEALGPREVE